jgi:hypothetical protein
MFSLILFWLDSSFIRVIPVVDEYPSIPMINEKTPDMLIKFVVNISQKLKPTPTVLPNIHRAEPEYWRFRMSHCSKPNIKPIKMNSRVRINVDSSSTYIKRWFKIYLLISINSRNPAVNEKIHKNEVLEFRRSTNHWARPIGTDKMITVAKSFIFVGNSAVNNTDTAAVALIPRILAATQTRKDLLRMLEFWAIT